MTLARWIAIVLYIVGAIAVAMLLTDVKRVGWAMRIRYAVLLAYWPIFVGCACLWVGWELLAERWAARRRVRDV